MPDKPEPKRAMKNVKRFLTDESGMGVVEILLITVGILTPYYGGSIKCIT